METVHDALESVATDVSAEYATEAELVLEHKQDAKLDSLFEDADVHITAEIFEPVAESIGKIVPQTPFEAHRSVEAEVLHPIAATQLHPDESVPMKAADVKLETTIPVSDSCVAGNNRLYSDVARIKYDVDGYATPQTETTTSVEISSIATDVRNTHDEAMEASSVKLPAESVEDVYPKLTSGTEYQLMSKDCFSFLVTSSPETSADIMAGNAGHFVDKSVEDVQAGVTVSDVTATSNARYATWPVAETMEKTAFPMEHSLQLSFTKQDNQVHCNEQADELQQPGAMPSVPVVDMKSAVELSTAVCDVTSPSIEVPYAGVSAELPPLASDNELLTSCYLPTAESRAAEADVESHVLTSGTEISDIRIVPEANVECSDCLPVVEENLDSPTSQILTEAPDDMAMALPAVEFQSTELGLLEHGVTVSAEEADSVAETAKEPTVQLHVAEGIPVLDYETVTEDEQCVAYLFSEGVRAVKIRSESAPGTRTVIENEVDKLNSLAGVTHTVSDSDKASKKSALSSAESFVAEILPYYCAALAVLREVERDAMQPRNPSLHCVDKTSVKTSHGIMKTNDAGAFTVSADYQESDAVPMDMSVEIEESTAVEGGVPETVLNNSSQSHKAAVSLSDSKSEQSTELLSKSVLPPAGKSGLQTLSTVDTRDKYLQDYSHADVVALQCHYQSLKLLHSMEIGGLPLFSLQLGTSSDRTSIVVKGAPAVSSEKQLTTDDSTDTSVYQAPRPSRDSLKDVSLEDDDKVSMCGYPGHQESRTVSSRLESADLPAAEDMTSVISLAQNSDVGISSSDDFAEVAQSMHADQTEHECNNFMMSIDNVSVSSKHDHTMSSSDLLITEPTSELPVRTMDNVTEVDVSGSQPYVTVLQDRRDDSNNGCEDKYTGAVGETGDFIQSSVIIKQYSLPEETDLTEELVPNVCVRELSLQQQQAADVRQTAMEQHADQEASCFSEQPPNGENINAPTSTDDRTLTPQEPTEEKAKKKKKNRKKKPKSPKDDPTHLEALHGCSDPPSVNQSNSVSKIIPENCSLAAAETGNVGDNGLDVTTLVSSEAPDAVASSTIKKTKKRKRTKKVGQVVVDNIAVDSAISEDTTALPATISEAEQSTLSRLEVSDHFSKKPSETIPCFFDESMVQKYNVSAITEAITHSRPENWNSQRLLSPLGVSRSETVGLSSTTTDDTEVELKLPDRILNAEESMPSVSPADVTVTINEENDFKKPVELCTQTVGLEISNSAVDGESASSVKPAKKKRRKKRKPKTTNVPSPGASIKESEVDKSCDNSVSLDFSVQNDEKLDASDVAEVEELMTESLEEDTKMTEQPLDILSVEDSQAMSEPSSFPHSAPLSKTATRKKKKRKTKASKIVQPCTTVGQDSHFVTESLPEGKDDLSEKDEIIDESSALNFTSETATTGLKVANLTITTGELDNTNVSLPVSRDEDWKEAEKETRFEVGSSGESSLDEYQLNVSYATEKAAVNTTVSESSEKRKKKRKRNRQKKGSRRTACSDAEIDTDAYSLLIRIIEICSGTKDIQAAYSSNQPQDTYTTKHDTDASQSIQAAKAARKPRKYKRSKPIRLPPDVAEQSAEKISLGVDDKTSVIATSPTHALQSADTQTSRMRPAAPLSEETRPDFCETLKFDELPSQLESTEDVNIKLSGSTVADDPTTVMQNVEETDTIIAWSASSSKMSDRSSECPWSSALPDPVLADPCEGQLTDVPRTHAHVEDTVSDSDWFTICPLDGTQTELQETCLEDKPTLTFDERHDIDISQTIPWNMAGCMTTDVFSVISEHRPTNITETSDSVNFSSEPIDDTDFAKPLTVLPDDNQQVPDADDSVGILDQNSNSCWFDGGGLPQAPISCCETSSVDSEVERIFANHVASDDRDDSSLIEEGVCSDSGKDADDDELALEDSDVVITEYVDVEIIEETETVTILDNDDLSPSVSDTCCPDTDETPGRSKYSVSGASLLCASGPVTETTGDVLPYHPYGFGLHENNDKYQLTGLPSDVNAENTKPPGVGAEDTPAHDSRCLGQKFCPQLFSNYSATGNRPTFHWPPTPEQHAVQSDVTDVLGLRRRFSRKRQYPSDDTSSSDSGDNKPGSDNSQFVFSHHQPALASENFASDPVPVWPFLASHAQWSTSDDVIGAASDDGFIGEQDLLGEPQVAAKPLARPWQNVAAAVPIDFDFERGSNLVRRERDFSRDEEELSGDSLNESGSTTVDRFFDEPKTFDRTTVSSDLVQESFGEACETCSTDSLDCQTKTEPLLYCSVRRRSSTDCISEDSLTEASFVAGKDGGDSTVNEDILATPSAKKATAASTQAVGEQRLHAAGLTKVSARRKKVRGVSARFKCPKPGVTVKTSRKRKLGNVEKDASDSGDTDIDSAELE